MAQLLYEALTGGVARIDSQSVLTVQSLLDSSATLVPELSTVDEEDIFQCGKCKKQFITIQNFLAHKKEGCANINTAGSTLLVRQLNGTAGGQTITLTSASLGQQQVPTSPLATLASGVVLSESDLLALTATIDQASLTPTSNGSSLIHSLSTGKCKTVTLHPDTSSLSPQQSIGLSFLTNANSTSLLVSNQANSLINMPGMMVNIGPSSFNKSSAEEKESGIGKEVADVLSVTAIPVTTGSSSDAQITATKSKPKGSSTVNIITEFHSSMVKSRKRGAASSSEGDATSSSKKQVRILRCAYCSKTFSKNFDLQQHIRCHTGEKPFQCIVCGRAFAQKSNVKKHLQTHKVWPDGLANTLPQVAADAVPSGGNGTSSNEQTEMETSSNTKTTDAVPIVDETNASTPLNNIYVCPYCNYNGKSYYKLKSHMKTHKHEKVYKCILNSCGQMVEDLDAFLEHIKSHENEMLYRCHLCTKTFQSLYDLGVHQYSHSLCPTQGPKNSPKYYRCNRCLNKYSTAAALDHHMATSSHSYPCPYCDKTFACERYLRRHLQTHGNSNLHTCEQCQKSFKTEHYLKIHKLIHTGEKPFLCCQCGASFNRQDKLKRHVLIHEPTKRLKCPFRNYSGCTKEFNRPDKLKAHIITHTSNKSFTCKFCNRTFNRRMHLKTHESTHEAEKEHAFLCGKCGIGFAKEVLLDEHECNEGGRSRKAVRTRLKYGRFLLSKGKKSKFTFVRKRGRPKKLPLREEACEENTLDDDIPTAHIEIISANGDLDVATTDLTQFSLQLHPIVTSSEMTGSHTVVATSEIPFISAPEVNDINVFQRVQLPEKEHEKKN